MHLTRRIIAFASGLLLACGASGAWAQVADSPAQARVRQVTRSAIEVFFTAGLPALRKSIASCYEMAALQKAATSLFLVTERCTAADQLGLIVFTAEQRRHAQRGESFDDVYLNPNAHRARVTRFWTSQGMDAQTRDQVVNAIYAVVQNEFMRQLPALAGQPSAGPAGATTAPAPAPTSPPLSTPTSP